MNPALIIHLQKNFQFSTRKKYCHVANYFNGSEVKKNIEMKTNLEIESEKRIFKRKLLHTNFFCCFIKI